MDNKESHLRSILKTLSWRILATMTTMIIAYFITGTLELALKIGFIEVFAKMIMYYFHERIWQIAPRGTIRKLQGRK
jgi:uncharacterized membrane protein